MNLQMVAKLAFSSMVEMGGNQFSLHQHKFACLWINIILTAISYL